MRNFEARGNGFGREDLSTLWNQCHRPVQKGGPKGVQNSKLRESFLACAVLFSDRTVKRGDKQFLRAMKKSVSKRGMSSFVSGARLWLILAVIPQTWEVAQSS